MSAYVVVAIEITDPKGFAKYQELAGPTMGKYGAKLLAKSNEVEVLEGKFSSPTVVVLEFESVDKAREWYRSREYERAIEARKGAARLMMFAVEGI